MKNSCEEQSYASHQRKKSFGAAFVQPIYSQLLGGVAGRATPVPVDGVYAWRRPSVSDVSIPEAFY